LKANVSIYEAEHAARQSIFLF